MVPTGFITAHSAGQAFTESKLKDLRNQNLPEGQLNQRVERFSDKPLSDGLSYDVAGNVYVTDIEHNAIFRVSPQRKLSTLIQAPQIRWPDALSFGPDGWLYVADSALPELILQSTEHIQEQGPYRVFRFQPGVNGVPGQ